jgi:inner membrane protein
LDPVTHALAGGLVARMGLANRVLPPELERRGVLWMAAFALAPDLDAVVELSGDPMAFLRYHRGFTHSLLGGAAFAFVLALVFARVFPGVPRRRVFVLTLAGVYIHTFLDLLTSYGTMLLWPFSMRRVTLDWLWTVDPTLTGILIGGVLAAYWLRRYPRMVAKASIALAFSYILLCGGLHWAARQAVAAEAVAQDIEGIQKVAVVPAPFVPLKWTGVVETEDTWFQAYVELGSARSADIKFTEVPKLTAHDGRAALGASDNPPLRERAQLYEWFARFPVVTVERDAGGQVVKFYDLRFNLPGVGEAQRPYDLIVRLDATGTVVDTQLH